MNFSAWFSQVTHRKPVDPGSGCHDIQPLLSLYSDKMTAPAESARVEAHLLECEDCRKALAWMQATNAVLAHREPALPPPDMSLRIRSAIADLETGKQARPARTPLVYRPAFAAAFTILIGAMVVAQITLHPSGNRPVAVKDGPKVASQPLETTPNVTPSASVKPNPTPTVIVPPKKNANVATRLPSDVPHEGAVGNGARPEAGDNAKHSNMVTPLTSKQLLAALPEVHIHSKAPKAFVIPTGGNTHVAQAPHNPLHKPPSAVNKHPDDTQIANRDTPSHDTTAAPINDAPTPPAPIAPTPDDTTRVASASSHANDILSGVRSKVDYMHTVAFALPSSARSVHLTRPNNQMGTVDPSRQAGTIDPSRGSASETATIVHDPGPGASSQRPAHAMEAYTPFYMRSGND
ncbi:hypothetical protein CCAX7_52200 [Capsulimonas corticalis]|uniref:Uncharacterized protein n=1 Tax=Capsulimonas corticalis TaxID=2219043 RepID=A0A402CP81_9BACT|nr:zf-HC2 domain-containing protein [Capsulimonas corticalis]BDI33169.1 hypothetical protein CCAX7_52200 [Capsulimonas corticalis]